MKNKGEHIKTNLSDFFDYKEGKMSEKERNAFERRLQQDPFEAEAAEGFARLTREESEEDLDKLSASLKRRTKRSRRIAWYSVAAALASILVVTTLFLTLSDSGLKKYETSPALKEAASEKESNLNKKEDQKEPQVSELREEPQSEVSENSAGDKKTAADPEQKGTDEISIQDDMVNQPQQDKSLTDEIEEDYGKVPAVDPQVAKVQKDDLDFDMGVIVSEENEEVSSGLQPTFEFEEEAADATEIEFVELDESIAGGIANETGLLKEAADQRPDADIAAGADAQKEVSATQSVSRKRSKASMPVSVVYQSTETVASETTQYIMPVSQSTDFNDNTRNEATDAEVQYILSSDIKQPSPEMGFEQYSAYLDSALVFPEQHSDMDSAVVIVSFNVKEDGIPENFSIVSSPSEAFSQKAIRAIDEGPKWNPARRNGEFTAMKFTYRVFFIRKK